MTQSLSQSVQAPRRCLVTGGAGFVGSHLVERLLGRGDAVTVIDDLSTGRRSNLDAAGGRIRFLQGDVSEVLGSFEPDAPFDEVYHLAAAVGVRLVLSDPIGSIETNVGGTDAVLRFAEAHGKPAVLIASSSEVYGKPSHGTFSEEDDTVYGPTSVTRWSYAASKALDEHLALAFDRLRGVPTVIARLFNTVGPRQVGDYGMVIPNFVRSALVGEPIRVFGDGSQSRCFCDVRDVVDGLIRLLGAPPARGRVFNIGSDEPISIMDLARLVVGTLGSGSEVVTVPYDEAYPSGFEDLKHRRPDLTRLREAIGWSPTIGLDTTIRDVGGSVKAAMNRSTDGAASTDGGRA